SPAAIRRRFTLLLGTAAGCKRRARRAPPAASSTPRARELLTPPHAAAGATTAAVRATPVSPGKPIRTRCHERHDQCRPAGRRPATAGGTPTVALVGVRSRLCRTRDCRLPGRNRPPGRLRR